MKIAIFLDHDIVIRNFIHGGAFRDLEREHEVVYVLPDPSFKRRVTIGLRELALTGEVKTLPIVQARQSVWSRMMHVNRLRWRSGPQAKYLRFSSRVAVGRFHAVQFTLAALPGVFQAYRALGRLKLARNPNRELEKLLENGGFDLIIHPTVMDGLFVNDLLDHSKRYGIPLYILMNSWDNISTCRYVQSMPDRLFVWGQQTEEHARDYLDARSPTVVRFGAAQFDVYRVPSPLSRDEFRAVNALPADKRILMYAGSSKILDEYAHLSMLEDWIEGGAAGDLHVYYRPHPWGLGGKGGGRILDRAWKHVTIDPTMREYLRRTKEGWDGVYLTDYAVMRDTLAHVDAVVSPLSTVVVEAAVMGRASMCYLPFEEESISFKRVSPLAHFVPVYESPDFVIARSRQEFLPMIEELLRRSQQEGNAERMRRAAAYFADSFEESYSARLARHVAEFLAGRPGSATPRTPS